MLSYPAAIPLSTRTLNHLAGLIRRHRGQRRSRWRRLEPGRQALLALAHLRNGDTYTRLACGFEIGVATAWRYVREAVNLLAASAEDLDTAMARIQAPPPGSPLLTLGADEAGEVVQATSGQRNRGRVRQHSEAPGWGI